MLEPTKIIKKLHECIGNSNFYFRRKENSEIWKCILLEGLCVTCITGNGLYIFHHGVQVMYISDRMVSQNKNAITNYHIMKNEDEFFNYMILNENTGYNRIDFVRLPEIFEYYIDLYRKRKK